MWTHPWIICVGLDNDIQDDPDLALEMGTAYMRVGRVQGVPISPNLGQTENAEQNLRIAERLIGSVLTRLPANRMAFLRAAQIAHDRMVLAESRRPDTEALPLAFESEKWLEKYLSTGPVDETEKNQVVIVGMNVANWYIRKERMDDGLRLIRRTIEIAKATSQRGKRAPRRLSWLARFAAPAIWRERWRPFVRESASWIQRTPRIKLLDLLWKRRPKFWAKTMPSAWAGLKRLWSTSNAL